MKIQKFSIFKNSRTLQEGSYKSMERDVTQYYDISVLLRGKLGLVLPEYVAISCGHYIEQLEYKHMRTHTCAIHICMHMSAYNIFYFRNSVS